MFFYRAMLYAGLSFYGVCSGVAQVNASYFPYRDEYPVQQSELSDIQTLSLDQDTLTDVVITDYRNNRLLLFYNLGTCPNSLSNKRNLASGAGPSAILAVDYDGDERKDMAVLNALSEDISVYHNFIYIHGDGRQELLIREEYRLPTAARPQAIINADIDGDTKTDLLIFHRNSPWLYVYRNVSVAMEDSLHFEADSLLLPHDCSFLELSDINHDGAVDWLMLNPSGRLYVYDESVYEPWQWGTAQVVDTGIDPDVLTTADLDADGKEEILISAGARIYLFSSTGSIWHCNDTLVSEPLTRLKTADLNNDGWPELTGLSEQSGTLLVFTNHSSSGAFSFSPFETMPAGDAPGALHLDDVNKDGKTDVLSCNRDYRNFSLYYQKKNTCSITRPFAADQTRIHPGPFTLTAFSGGEIYWYADSSLHDIMGKGFQHQVSWVAETDTFYVTNNLNCCESQAVPVIAKILCTLEAPPAGPWERCEAGMITIPVPDGMALNWYKHTNDTAPFHVGPSSPFLPVGTVANWNVSFRDEHCESERIEVAVTVFPPPLPATKAYADYGSCNGGRVRLYVPSSQQHVRYEIRHSGEVNHRKGNGGLLELGEYAKEETLRVFASNLCDSLELPVVHRRMDVPLIPNLITPNHDGQNDQFMILHHDEAVKLALYDRWGAQVFASDRYANDWGTEAATGIYYYVLDTEVCHSPATYTGWVQVLK